jgi:hypothetical protein
MAHLLERLQSSFSPQILASAVLTARVTRNGYPAGEHEAGAPFQRVVAASIGKWAN